MTTARLGRDHQPTNQPHAVGMECAPLATTTPADPITPGPSEPPPASTASRNLLRAPPSLLATPPLLRPWLARSAPRGSERDLPPAHATCPVQGRDGYATDAAELQRIPPVVSVRCDSPHDRNKRRARLRDRAPLDARVSQPIAAASRRGQAGNDRTPIRPTPRGRTLHSEAGTRGPPCLPTSRPFGDRGCGRKGKPRRSRRGPVVVVQRNPSAPVDPGRLARARQPPNALRSLSAIPVRSHVKVP